VKEEGSGLIWLSLIILERRSSEILEEEKGGLGAARQAPFWEHQVFLIKLEGLMG